MHQTLELLATEVNKSQAAVENLDQQTNMLKEVGNEYSSYSDTIKQSRVILGRLNRRDFLDKLMLYGSFAFFMLTVLYIMWRRVWLPNLGFLVPSFGFGELPVEEAERFEDAGHLELWSVKISFIALEEYKYIYLSVIFPESIDQRVIKTNTDWLFLTIRSIFKQQCGDVFWVC